MSPPLSPELFDKENFEKQLAEQSMQPVALFKNALTRASDYLSQCFNEGRSATELVSLRARVVDEILSYSWKRFFDGNETDIALLAVGGYGRGELHPYSDIDLQILAEKSTRVYEGAIVGFTTFLWDIGLKVGHSVRTLKECISEAKQDITVATNIQEARLLCGPIQLFEKQKEKTGPNKIWPSKKFFSAKYEEQLARHRKFNDTAYNLEPNIKEGPGGLRDIQMIGWVAKRHFNASTLHDLVKHHFLTEEEYKLLNEGQAFLWQVRFAMHIATGRCEDRLLLDHQRSLAAKFGYQDDPRSLGVEKFMRQYYRTVMELSRLNEMLLNLFQEELLFKKTFRKPKPLNKRFQVHNNFIEVAHDRIFKHYPFALLEIFLLMTQNQQLKGVRANTIRLIRQHLYLIDDDFRNDLGCQSLFMEILRQPQGITHELRRMNRYGVLAAYLPVFGNIVGLMQHNLFHVYTVDEHSLMVIRNMRRFTVAEFRHEFPLCSDIIQTIPKQELLILSGLFHDIAKGRGGDHSSLGAQDALEFSQRHKLSRYDANLISWLVESHLLMSTTAQRKDISDPEIIHEFATQVGELNRLNYLYLLTVADIRATGPDVWNSWKDSLLKELYLSTKRALRRGLNDPMLASEHIASTKEEALNDLRKFDIDEFVIEKTWQQFDDEYFQRHSANEVSWHTQSILNKNSLRLPPIVVERIRPQRAGTEIFVYSKTHEKSFAQITSILEQLSLSIVDARIMDTHDAHTLSTLIVLDESGEAVTDNTRLTELKKRIKEQLKNPEQELPAPHQHIPRQVKAFRFETNVQFWLDDRQHRTAMQIIATDRPGLLSRIARALIHCEIQLHNAKIATFGEKAEDIFYITNSTGNPLEDEAQFDCIKQAIRQFVDND